MAKAATVALLLGIPVGGAVGVFLKVPDVVGPPELLPAMLLAFALGMLARGHGVAYGFALFAGVLGCATATAVVLAAFEGLPG